MIWCLLSVLLLTGCRGRGAEERSSSAMVLASTTSTQDSGILDELVPAFERAHPGWRVKVVAVGSGEAIELGARGDADVLLVHSPDDEAEFMRSGKGVHRKPVMSNSFLLAGPPSDPANVREAASVHEAFRRVMVSESSFVSRGDLSGTHKKELELWNQIKLSPDGDWYLSTGQGMAETLTVAAEKSAYVLTDAATFRVVAPGRLTPLFDGGIDLVNPYSVIPLKAAKAKDQAIAFSAWLTGPGQELIARFGVASYGEALFESVEVE